MIVTEGGRWAGYGLYLLKGQPVFTYNLLGLLTFRWANESGPPLTAGRHTISFDFKYDGPGIAKSGTGDLKVDDMLVRTVHVPKTIPFLIPPDETFDIGDDTRTGVNDKDYTVPFPFDGKINKLIFNLGPSQLSPEEEKSKQEGVAKAKD